MCQKLKQENGEFEVSLSYIFFTHTNKKTNIVDFSKHKTQIILYFIIYHDKIIDVHCGALKTTVS